jgi:hypothetical protein
MSEPVAIVEPAIAAPAITSPETATAVAVPLPAAAEDPLFTQQEILALDADDGDAGRSIGKMLASFFLYTVCVMLIVAWWTVRRNHLETRLDAQRFGQPAAAVQEQGSDASTTQPSKTGENAQE